MPISKWTVQESTFSAGHPDRMPNPKRVIAGEIFPENFFSREYHVHFISISPNATAAEQYHEFKGAVEHTHTKPIQVRDGTGNTTRFCIYVNSDPSDNPMASEICAHIGGQGNYPCRKCRVGGTKRDKSSDEGYHALFAAGPPLTQEWVLSQLETQVKLACSDTGVKDSYTQFWINDLLERFQTMKKNNPQKPVHNIENELVQWTSDNRDKIYSPFFMTKGIFFKPEHGIAVAQTYNLGLDPTKDTPIELLHTILLGIVKYIWHATHTGMSPEQKKIFASVNGYLRSFHSPYQIQKSR
ncbi:hypothetical protein B0H14DRAFT_2618003 [Mycena olivaceomarginata]|nr:hypothetical protein B0H14DRAFT_2618003 [Mycena olivaceomarginata]